MPTRPLRPCSRCGRLGAGRLCEIHLREERRALDARRGKTAARGYGGHHREWREVILARDPICCRCGRKPSTIADHIVPLEDGGTWELSNGQGLDGRCHAIKTGEDVRRRRVSAGRGG